MTRPSDRFARDRAQRAVRSLNNGPDLLPILFSYRFWVLVAVITGTIAILTQ